MIDLVNNWATLHWTKSVEAALIFIGIQHHIITSKSVHPRICACATNTQSGQVLGQSLSDVHGCGILQGFISPIDTSSDNSTSKYLQFNWGTSMPNKQRIINNTSRMSINKQVYLKKPKPSVWNKHSIVIKYLI